MEAWWKYEGFWLVGQRSCMVGRAWRCREVRGATMRKW